MQNRIVFLCAILFALITTTTAQEHHLGLKSGSVLLDPQTALVSSSEVSQFSDKDRNSGAIVLGIAEGSIPVRTSKVEPLHFIGGNSYYVWVTEGVDQEAWSQAGFDAIYEIDPEWKIDPALNDPSALDWALDGDEISVRALTFLEPDQESIKYSLSDRSYENLEVDHLIKAVTVKIPVTAIAELASLPWVYWLEPITPPLETNNLVERTNHRVLVLEKGAGLYDLSGKGVVVGEWDGGGADKHIDYDFLHIQKQPFYNNGNGQHATHVAGTVLGAGIIDPDAMGMAPQAGLVSYDFYGNIPSEMDSAAILYDIELTQNSYSYGSSSDPCSRRGTYDGTSYALDLLTNKYPYLLHVFAAGNSRGSNCLSGGYGTVHSGFQASKNSLVVGAVTRYDGNSSFHSYGPVKDGRLKPEICGVGVSVYSTFPYNTYRGGYSGTSMACPGVSGTASLIHELYQDKFSSQIPAHLLKGSLCNGADELGRSGPDYQYGYGRINAQRTARIIDNEFFSIDSVNNNGVYEDTIFISADLVEFKVMLCWNDPASSPSASRLLVNDLDLEVIDSAGTTYLPWVLNASSYTATAGRGRDSLNPIEQFTISNPNTPYYVIRVKGKRVNSGFQQFSVNWLMQEEEVTVIYPNGGEHWLSPSSSGRAQIIRWDDYGLSGTTRVEFSADAGRTWSTLAGSVASNRNYYQWQNASSALYTAQARIRVTKGGVSDTSNNNFHIGAKGPTPSATICSGQLHLQWAPQSRAIGYKVYMLDSGLMRLQGTTTNPFFTIKGLDNGQDYWVSVAIIDQTGAEGPRSNGVRFRPVAGVNPVEFVAQPSNRHICAGNSVNFSATANGTLSIFYRWQESDDNGASWRNLSNLTTSLSIANAGIEYDDRLYRISGVNQCRDTVFSKAAYLRVDTVLQYSMRYDSIHLCLGQDSSIELDLKASNEPVYRWFYKKRITDNLKNLGTSGRSFERNNVTEAQEGYYGVQLVNQCGTVGPNSFTFMEVRPPLSIINELTDTVCVGASTTLSIEARGGDPNNYMYKWIVNGREYTQQGIVLYPTVDQTITAAVFDNCSADTVKRNIDIVMRDKLEVDLGVDQVICNGQTFNIEAKTTGGDKAGYSYRWSDGNTSGAIREVDAFNSGTYAVTLTDNCTVDPATDEINVQVREPLELELESEFDTACYLQEFEITVNANGGFSTQYNFLWDGAPGPQQRTFKLTESRSFIVELEDGCTPESSFDTIYIVVRDSLKLQIIGQDTACSGETVQFTAEASGGNPMEYLFLWNGTEGAQTMDLVASDVTPLTVRLEDGCTPQSIESEKEIFIREPLSAALLATDYIICKGEEIGIGFQPQGGRSETYTILWSNGMVDAETITVSPESTTKYDFTLSDGCTVPEYTNSIEVVVRSELKVDLGPDLQKCAEDQRFLQLQGSGGIGDQYRWFVNGAEISGEVLEMSDSVTATYVVELRDDCTVESGYDTLEVLIVPLENTSFMVEGRDDKLVKLKTTESPNTILYYWGDGSTSTETDAFVEHLYADHGTYKICKTESDNIGCKRSHCEELDLYDPFGVSEIGVEVFPNPSSSSTFVRTDRISGNVQLLLYDATGKLLIQKELTNTSETLFEIDLTSYSTGMYFLHVEVNGERNVFPVVKQ